MPRIDHRRRWLLATLLMGAAVLFAVVLAFTAHVARSSALEALAERSEGDLRLYIANVRRELEKYEYLPALLGEDERLADLLRHPDRAALLKTVNHYLELTARVSGASDIYLMDTAGDTLAASNWRQTRTFIGDNYSFRPYFKQAIAGGLGRYFAKGWRSGERGYYFAYPLSRRGRTLGVVVVKVAVPALEAERADDSREFVVTDPHGVIFLATEPAWRLRTLTPIDAAERAAIRESQRYGDSPLRPLGFKHRRLDDLDAELLAPQNREHPWLRIGLPMPSAGWTVHVFADTAQVDQQVTRAVLLSASGLGAAILAALIVWQRRLRLRERMRFEHESRAAAAAGEARVRAIIDNARAGLLTLDGDGYVVSCNPTAAVLFQRDAGDLKGRFFTRLVGPRDTARFIDQLALAAASDDKVPVIELTGVGIEGRRFPLEVGLNRMDMPEGRRYLVTLHDVSAQKESERALRRAHDQLEQRVTERTADLVDTNRRLTHEIERHRRTETELRDTRDELVQAAKLAAIGELAAGINHELNQPLTAIRAFADNARAYLGQNRAEPAEENLERIGDLTERMGRIIRQLQLFARKSSGPPSPVGMDAVVDAALALLSPRLEREGIEVRRELAPDMWCLGDMVRLEQVFVNLIGNAAHAMEGHHPKRIVIAGARHEEYVEVTVRDTGRGISETALPHLFDAFYTTKRAGQGLGLGLSISTRIVEELGGRMTARNHSGGGAVFTVVLPAAQRRETLHG